MYLKNDFRHVFTSTGSSLFISDQISCFSQLGALVNDTIGFRDNRLLKPTKQKEEWLPEKRVQFRCSEFAGVPVDGINYGYAAHQWVYADSFDLLTADDILGMYRIIRYMLEWHS